MIEMTTSMGLQLTPGQRCLLDLLQRKLLSTIQSYAKMSLEKRESTGDKDVDQIDAELQRLKDKIRRISARQKRFTLEIINKNGNNTIPKESFFQALGLVTKEALNKLNSKSNERRRRTTANPRFSHEAIQAKRALEPLQKGGRSGNRSSTLNRNRKPAPQPASTNNSNNNNNNNNSTNNLDSQKQAELLAQFDRMQRQIDSRNDQIRNKRESNKRLEKQNELIRKRGLDIISAINLRNPTINFIDKTDDKHHSFDNNKLSRVEIGGTNDQQIMQPTSPGSPALRTDQLQSPKTQETYAGEVDPELWIDMKCDETLDGLD